MTVVLCLKLTLVPALIYGVTLAGRRWGATVAGWLSAFPIVAGPILFFVALEHGPIFAATAASGTLSAVLAVLAFGTSYAWTATKHGWPLSLLAGLCGYFLAVAVITLTTPPLALSALAVAAALVLAPRLYPVASAAKPACAPPAGDIPLRMIAGGLLVLLVTQFAARLGPHMSGVFAMFPVMGSVLAVFSHRHAGAGFTICLLRGMVLGFYSFSAFCLVLSLALPVFSIGTAFLAAFGTALLAQGLSHILRRSTPVPAPAATP